MLTDYNSSFTDGLSLKFVVKSSLNNPPHLKCVTALPYEIPMFENNENMKRTLWLIINHEVM